MSLWLTTHPIAHRINVNTFSAKGAEPTSINLNRPPIPSWTFLNTNMSQKLFFLTIPLKILLNNYPLAHDLTTHLFSSLSLELKAILNKVFLIQFPEISDWTLSYILFSSLGTAGVTVGFNAFISSLNLRISPRKNPTAPPCIYIAHYNRHSLRLFLIPKICDNKPHSTVPSYELRVRMITWRHRFWVDDHQIAKQPHS